jgi:hypothetical protein
VSLVASIAWVEPPPKQRRRSPRHVDHDLIANQLRERPGVWALIPAAGTGLAGQIGRGDIRAYRPARSFEAVRRDDHGAIRVYARYLGQESR